MRWDTATLRTMQVGATSQAKSLGGTRPRLDVSTVDADAGRPHKSHCLSLGLGTDFELMNQDKYNPFYWSGDEPLTEIEKPERIAEIKRKWAESQEKAKQKTKSRFLLHILGDTDEDDDGEKDGCLICHV